MENLDLIYAKTFVAGPAALVEIKDVIEERASTAAELDEIVIILLPHDFPVREICRVKNQTVISGFPSEKGKDGRIVEFRDGDEFKVTMKVPYPRVQTLAGRRITNVVVDD